MTKYNNWFTSPYSAIFLTCITFQSFISCSSNNERVNELNLFPSTIISQINDSTFITDGVSHMSFVNENLLISDRKALKTLSLNIKDLSVLFEIDHGFGPDNIKESYHIEYRKNRYYVSDFGKNTFSVFDADRNPLSSINPPHSDMSSFLYKFSVDDNGYVYYTDITNNYPITQLDQTGRVIREFGEFQPYENEDHKRALNNRNLVVTEENELLSIWTSVPIIKKFNQEGNLIDELDLSDFFQFRTNRKLELIKTNPQYKYRLAFAYYNDVYYSDKKLYLLFIGDYEVPNSNQVLVIDTSKKRMQIQKVLNLHLPEAYFKEITISGSKLWAFDKAGAEIIEFKMDLK
ncbi:hypothetical protein [uncultured Roseivirga sp.]|uniref:hypothetical protein n=1 Tax=uncultured Roseivirga sp. TaxID=543088 RepID=UPI0030DB1791|tara:strand:- start:40461 stop:41501 length:1041 start_codon:yes stop_codon:yes gene_type:complete